MRTAGWALSTARSCHLRKRRHRLELQSPHTCAYRSAGKCPVSVLGAAMSSVLEDFGNALDSGRCGYCGDNEQCTDNTEGERCGSLGAHTERRRRRLRGALWAHRLRLEDYRVLMDHGWRRSGCFLYFPDNDHGCCPQYAVRVPLWDFELTRSQRRVLRRWQNFVSVQGDLAERCFIFYGLTISSDLESAKPLPSAKLNKTELQPGAPKPVDDRLEQLRIHLEPSLQRVPVKRRQVSGGAHFTTAIAWKLAYEHRTFVTQEAEQLAARLWDRGAAQLGITRMEVSNGHVNLYDSLTQSATETECRSSRNPCARAELPDKPIRSKPVLRMELLPAAYREDAFHLYCKYQRRVHGDTDEELKPDRYSRFLVEHPFHDDGKGRRLGVSHLHFYIDDVLVIVSVLDMLPGCLSSKYCFYDPDLPSRLSPGIFAALCEIQLAWTHLGASHYYLGYYIHSCSKMRYKVSFRRAQLLCGHCFRWQPFANVARDALDRDEHCVGFCNRSRAARATNDANGAPGVGVGGVEERHSRAADARLEKVLVWLLDASGCSAALAPQPLSSVETVELRERIRAALQRLAAMVPPSFLERIIYLPPRQVFS